jgi:hypothetical protein
MSRERFARGEDSIGRKDAEDVERSDSSYGERMGRDPVSLGEERSEPPGFLRSGRDPVFQLTKVAETAELVTDSK